MAPLGAPLAVSETVAAVPAVTAVETVAVVEEPAATDALVGETAMEKLLAVPAVTVSEYGHGVGLGAFHAGDGDRVRPGRGARRGVAR